jgi:hypothetical protein
MEGFRFEFLWNDNDVFQLRIRAWNGNFGDTTHVYVPIGAIAEAAETLEDFPPRTSDKRDLQFEQFCTPIDNFFERAGMVNPPYGLSGDQENSAVFSCKKAEKNENPYNLMFKARDPKQLAGCQAIIEWRNPPGGLSIETRRHLALGDFRYVTAPKRVGPASVVTNANVIVNYYHGLTGVFYSYKDNGSLPVLNKGVCHPPVEAVDLPSYLAGLNKYS